MFATVLRDLKSPENTGMILRTHVAFDGGPFVMIGSEPWRFKKRSQAFSRKLEMISAITYLPDDDAFFAWCKSEAMTPVAVEIAESAVPLPSFQFPERSALIVGHEAHGLSEDFIAKCKHTVMIPQFGPVACLNVAVSCCIAIYEFNRAREIHRKITRHAFEVAAHETPAWIEEHAKAS